MKFLKGGKKIAGLPRNAWIVLLIGAVVVGLYLRRRRAAANAAAQDTGQPIDYSQASGDTLAGQSDAGLAGVGVASPPGGVYPVTTPTVPEGLPDILAGQQQVISDLAGGYNPPNAIDQNVPVPTINVTLPTGGGPPKRRPHTPAGRAPAAVKGSAEARRRYASIVKRHGASSGAAKRAKKRLGIR